MKAHRLLYHSSLGSRVIKKKDRVMVHPDGVLDVHVVALQSRMRLQVLRNSPPPQGHHRALRRVLLQGPRGALFRMSEVPL